MNDEQKIKLEQYRNILGYLQYENRTYWTRSGFMIVAQTILFRFITQKLPLVKEEDFWFNITAVAFSCILGFYLTSLWRTINKSGKWWIERWHSILLELEPDAYGDIEVFRGVVDNTKKTDARPSVKQVVEQVTTVFLLIWILSSIYVVVKLLFKVEFFSLILNLFSLFYQFLLKVFFEDLPHLIDYMIDNCLV